jgi:transposase
MEHYAAIDVSLEWSSVCVVDAAGQIVHEAKVPSEREALVGFFAETGLAFTRIGLEAGPLSQWLHAGLVAAGLPAILIETRHVKAALKAMTVKTDRNDARGMAQLTRMGWFRPVHVKAPIAQEIRALLTARRLLVAKLRDLESSMLAVTLMADLRYVRLAIARRHFSFLIDRAILLTALAVVAVICLVRLID